MHFNEIGDKLEVKYYRISPTMKIQAAQTSNLDIRTVQKLR